MTTTVNQDRDFISSVISSYLLEDSLQFIKDTFSAEEIFGKDELDEWALKNGYVKNDE